MHARLKRQMTEVQRRLRRFQIGRARLDQYFSLAERDHLGDRHATPQPRLIGKVDKAAAFRRLQQRRDVQSIRPIEVALACGCDADDLWSEMVFAL